MRRAYAVPDSTGQSAVDRGAGVLMASFREQLMLLLVPLVVMAANALVVKNCSLLEGLGFFLLLPVVSVLFSVSLGFFFAAHYRGARTVFTGFFVVTMIYALALGYYTPAIFSYNFFYGFFPGLTYDEALGVSWTLAQFRLVTLVVAFIFVWLGLLILSNSDLRDPAWKKGLTLLKTLLHRRHRLTTLVAITFLVVLFLFRQRLGFESHRDFIQERLGATYRTAHFIIYYDRNSIPDDEIAWIGAEHEFQRDRILATLRAAFPWVIESYIYPSSEVKERLMGAGTTNIAKPWTREIHLSQQSLAATLAHELVHVLVGPFGMPIIHANMSTGLVEGLAVAIDSHWGNRTLHQYTAALYRFGSIPDITALMSFQGFAKQSSAVSYVATGSFCRFIIDRYGIGRILRLYSNGSYERLYGRSLQELAREWRVFLERVPVAEEDSEVIDALFRRPPIMEKVCPRVIARRNREAGGKYAEKDYAAAAALYERSYLEGKSYDALSGYLASSLRLHNFGVLVSALDSIIARDPHPAQYLPLALPIGDALWGAGNTRWAAEIYTWLRRANVSDRLTEAATLRVFSLNDSVQHNTLLSYIFSDAQDSVRLLILDSLMRAAPGNWIPSYWKARALLRLRRFESCLAVLRSFTLASRDQFLEAFRLRMEGEAEFRLKNFQEAKVLFWTSLNYYSTEMAVYDVDEYIDRCEWMTRYTFP